MFCFVSLFSLFAFFSLAKVKAIISLDSEKEEIIEQKNSVNESLVALKDCKRVVELRYKNILSEKSDLDQKVESITQQSELLQVKNQSLDILIL